MSTDVDRYRALRAESYTPESALHIARHPVPKFDDASVPDEVTINDFEGWRVQIHVERDDDYERGLGSFVSTPTADTVDLGRDLGPLGYRYFLPNTTHRQHRDGLSQRGYARHEADCLARRYVREDLEEELGIAFPAFIVTVRVLLADVEFGVDAIGGVVFGAKGIRTPQEVVDYVFETSMYDVAAEVARTKLAEVLDSAPPLQPVPSTPS